MEHPELAATHRPRKSSERILAKPSPAKSLLQNRMATTQKSARLGARPQRTLCCRQRLHHANSDVTTGTTLTGSTTVTGGFVPETTHVWELNGVEDQRGTINTTAKEGTVHLRRSHRLFSTVIGDWSDPVSVTEPITPPNATMFGLRFDQSRHFLSGVSGSWHAQPMVEDASTGWVWQHQHLTSSHSLKY